MADGERHQRVGPWIFNRSDGGTFEFALAGEDGGEHLNQIPWEHAYLHEGNRYDVPSFAQALANGGTLEILVQVGATLNLHLVAEASVGGDFVFELWENVAGFTGGSSVTAINHNRESALTTEASFVQDPATIDLAGSVLIGEDFIPGGSGGNAQGTTSGRDEFILKRDTDYLYRFTNIAGQAKAISVLLDFYEHEPVGVGVE